MRHVLFLLEEEFLPLMSPSGMVEILRLQAKRSLYMSLCEVTIRYNKGAHTKTDLKVHLIWVPKYRRRILTGEVAVRRDILRQIAMEHELEIISGKVAGDHVHMFIAYRLPQNISKIVAEGYKLADFALRVCPFAQTVLGKASVGTRILRDQLWKDYGRDDPEIYRGAGGGTRRRQSITTTP